MHMDLSKDSLTKPAKTGGRPPLKFNEAQKAKVVELARLGIPHDQIAFALRISTKTLRKHFHDVLYDCAIEANKEVLTKLFQLAISGNPTAATFWARTRCQFRAGGSILDEEPSPPNSADPESIEPFVTNNDGAPLED
jgi:hypothetical protein